MAIVKYYWQAHRRYVQDGRMSWHAEAADETFWFDYWQERVTPGYYAAAERFDLTADELGRVLLHEMAPDGLHLEAGCGAGYWVAALQRAGLNVEGIEYAPELVDLVNAVYPALPVRFGDALAIDRPDATYDSYLSFGVVEHRREGPEPFMAEAYRVLKPGGKAIITVPHFGPVRSTKASLSRYESRRPALPFFQYGFRAAEFAQFLRGAGFLVDAARPLYVHRLLQEESDVYRRLIDRRGGRLVRDAARRLLQGRDGHMLLVIAHKPV